MGHSDADGLTSTAILSKALDRLGYEVNADTTRKGENGWSESALARVAEHDPHALIVVDLGSRNDPLLAGIPALLIDHHRPTGVPAGASLLSGYTLRPVPTSSLLAFWCAEGAGVADHLDWLGAVGILGDLGEKNGFREWDVPAARYGKAVLRQLTTLINAPRRAASGDAMLALKILLDADSPSAALRDPRIEQLEAAKAAYNAALVGGRRVAPLFSGELALILVHSPCQIHPALAQTWAGRLRKNFVLCANTGFLPGRVNFALRTNLDRNLLEFLAGPKPSGTGNDYGRGHDRATGGSLSLGAWAEFITRLGFPAEIASKG